MATRTPTATPMALNSRELVENARKHIVFLEDLHSLGITLDQPTKESLHRYKLWLNLIHKLHRGDSVDATATTATATGTWMIPPADIAWLWHCHRLAPCRYVDYLRTQFPTSSVLLEAHPPFTFQHPLLHPNRRENKDNTEISNLLEAKINTEKIWTEHYPNEPFFQDCDNDLKGRNTTAKATASSVEATAELPDRMEGGQEGSFCEYFASNKPHLIDAKHNEKNEWCGFDLIGSTERQAGFLWQVTQPQFESDEFLHQGVESYYKFLCLKKNHDTNKFMIVPTYQIDLFWHTHILTNLKRYFDDCQEIIGEILHHDDSLSDRTEGGSLDQAFRATKALWSEVYDGEEYYCPGGMYRGEPPSSYFARGWPGEQRLLHAHSIGVGPFWKMIDVQGATSTSPPRQWTLPDGTAPDGQPGFVPPNARSTTRGTVSNGLKDGYIFGKGPKGVGYYHNTTREAYVILHQRITARIRNLEQSIACDQCCGGQPSKNKVDELNQLMDMQELVKARMQSSAPFGDGNLPAGLKAQMQSKNEYGKYYSSDGVWYFPDVCYKAGGGCGACGFDGGGCGGAAGCGGGGCGGGGCGGGGCGG